MNLKLLTLNLLYADASRPADDGEAGTWSQRRGVVEKILREHRPDVVGMQEVQDEQLRDLCERLPEYEPIPGPVNGVDRMPLWTLCVVPPLMLAAVFSWRQRERCNRTICDVASATSTLMAGALLLTTAILARKKGNALRTGGHCPLFVRRGRFRIVESGAFWVSHRPQKPNSVLIGTWLPRIVNWARLEELKTGRSVTVFDTHLDWWFLAHRRSAKILARELGRSYDGSPQILMGDFNATPESALYRVLISEAQRAGAPFCDAWQRAAEKSGPQETYHGGDGEGCFPGRVDHILLRPTAKIECALTLEDHDGEIYPSDHFPLLAEIEWR